MPISGWLLGQANAAYIAASGENPIISLLDLLTLAAPIRMVIESWLVPHYPAPQEPWDGPCRSPVPMHFSKL